MSHCVAVRVVHEEEVRKQDMFRNYNAYGLKA